MAASGALQSPQAPEVGQIPVDVLVAEDDPCIAALIQTVLEEEGYRVTAVGSGQGVLDAVQRRAPDLLLLDVRLEPGLTGWDVLQRLEADHHAVPTVMVTGDSRTAGAPPASAAAVLAKPFDLDELLATVARHAARN